MEPYMTMNLQSSALRTLLLLSAVMFPTITETTQTSVLAQGMTTLTDKSAEFRKLDSHYVILEQSGVSMIVVDNAAVDIPELPGHRAGYNGVASLKHAGSGSNLFVPAYAGLNFEHIHDGTTRNLIEKFEPRKFPMELRLIDSNTVEVYQPATGNWQLESCGRYSLQKDGTIEYSFECIPRKGAYAKGYIGLFWASYINGPENKAIHFRGRSRKTEEKARWIDAISPQHGVNSTHEPTGNEKPLDVDKDFPLSLIGNQSAHEYTEPWFYGTRDSMVFLQVFRPADNIWFAQSPSGGGNGNPAWDFQWFIHSPVQGKAYGFKMRAAYFPEVNRNKIQATARKLLKLLIED